MAHFPFEKWQGTGNHHVVIEREHLPAPLTPELARALTNPNFGIGADGILEISWDGPTPRMTVWNADGSLAENCGNGIRIVARYLAERSLLPDDGAIRTGRPSPSPTLTTHASVHDDGAIRTGRPSPSPTLTTHASVHDDGTVTVRMGQAVLPGGASREGLPLEGEDVQFLEVRIGNSHAVIEAATPETLEAEMLRLGPVIETHPRFPNRTNVEFVHRTGPHHATVQVWERGVGPTLACGTGACAVAAALVATGAATSPLTVSLPGGDLTIEIGPDHTITMTGDARRIYRGEIDLAELPAVVAPEQE